mmetsp:Transcript_6720/g.6603  ORF Transcript_6720/g.6603 Transcript_6720/m.6603 type:complete len:120 (+) Transcript_6720:1-360(+)
MGSCQIKIEELKDALLICHSREKFDSMKKNPDSLLKTIVIESKLLSPEKDPEFKHIQTFFELHRNKIHSEVAHYYQKIITNNEKEISEVSFKCHPLRTKQTKYLSLLLPYCLHITHLHL